MTIVKVGVIIFVSGFSVSMIGLFEGENNA